MNNIISIQIPVQLCTRDPKVAHAESVVLAGDTSAVVTINNASQKALDQFASEMRRAFASYPRDIDAHSFAISEQDTMFRDIEIVSERSPRLREMHQQIADLAREHFGRANVGTESRSGATFMNVPVVFADAYHGRAPYQALVRINPPIIKR